MSGISIDLNGVDKTLAKLKKLGLNGRRAALKIVTIGTLRIHKDVIDSLGTDGKTGTIRPSAGDRSQPHQASAPGEAPSSDTGELRKGVTFKIDSSKIEGTIRSKAPYSLDLELGTHDMEPRPFLVPAFYRNLPAINQDSKEAWHQAMNEE